MHTTYPLLHLLRAGLVTLMAMAGASGHAAHVNTPIDYAVTESGAATLSLAIQVPRGIGGMEPQLSLAYSSSAGNGLVGLGWVLTGPSTISRCPMDLVNDLVRGSVNFDTNDRFCLDGQRLIQTSGGAYGGDQTQYRTQRDTFSRITSIGNYLGADGSTQVGVPASFRVETKSGLIMDFGISSNSQVPTNFPSGTRQTVNRWMLQRISDRTANQSFVEFVYCSGLVSADGGTCTTTTFYGSTVPQYIRYTNRNGLLNGENAVIFRYENRRDANVGYHLGSASTQAQRITSIETYRDFTGPTVGSRGNLVKGYDIGYEATEDASGNSIRATNVSRVVSITERDNAGNTLPALSFTTAPDSVFGMSAVQPVTTTTATVSAPRAAESCGGVIGARISMVCK